MKTLTWTAVVVGLLGASSFANAQQAQNQQQQQRPRASTQQSQQQQQQARTAWLGVGVEAVPEAMRSHMPDTLLEGQGVLIGQVAKDSPAAKAGLRTHDVILSFNNQKVGSPEQLVKMVRSAAPGQQAAISYLRGGKTANCNVTLGEAPQQENGEGNQVYRFRPDEQFEQFFFEKDRNNEHGWTNFEGMKLSRTGEHTFSAEIEYKNKEGKKETKKFAGSREEIRKAIQNDKDMPHEDREHLLRALNMGSHIFEFHLPSNGGFSPENLPQRP